jgi:hypothetical protein
MKISIREVPGMLPDRIIEVIRRGYIRKKPNRQDQIHQAWVKVSSDIEQMQTVDLQMSN